MTPNSAGHTVRGMARALFLARVKAAVAGKFLPLIFRRELSPRRYALFLRRLLLFLSKLEHNKFVRIGGATRMDLYVPGFPSEPFWTACRKFLTFEGPTPCSTVLLSVTSGCRFSCRHCYQRLDRGPDLPVDTLLAVVRTLQRRGVAFFNVEGGDPFLVYDRLKAVCGAVDRRSEVWVNSTGDGMTVERLRELRALNLTAVMFSLHRPEAAGLNDFMQSDRAWDTMCHGVADCHEAGVPVAFNTCVSREGFANGEFDRLMNRARDFGACLVQVIKPKPAGAWLAGGAPGFGAADLAAVRRVTDRYNHDPAYAGYPAVAAQIVIEDPDHFGCTAGGTDRFYVNAKGDVQPCEFLNLSFGNVRQEDFEGIVERMRRSFAVPGENWLCEACAPALREAMAREQTSVLPLSPPVSERLLAESDRGRPTRVYASIERFK